MDLKLRNKLDLWFWFLMMFLPILLWFATIRAVPESASFLSFVDSNFAFPFIRDILDSVSNLAFGSAFALSGYLSYLVALIIFHALFDVIAFIPRLAHKFINWGIDKC